MLATFPSERRLPIEDNRSAHHSRDTRAALAAWPEVAIQFLPRHVAWLTRIAPWWEELRDQP